MTDPYQETFETWNKIAGLYEERFMHLDLYNKSYDAFCERLPKRDASLLEVGCGPGNITRYLLDKRPDLSILGLDVAPAMVELARKNNPEARFEVMDIRQLHELKGNFDAFISGFCIPYLSLEESARHIADARRLLNSNGLLYLSFIEGDPERSGFMSGSSGDRVYFYYHRLQDLQNALQQQGFQQDYYEQINYTKADASKEVHTVLLAIKKM